MDGVVTKGSYLALARKPDLANIEGSTMTLTFTTCPFKVVAGDTASIVIEDRKTGQSWRLSNDQAREFGRLLRRHRKLAELAEYAPSGLDRIRKPNT